jgi:hypothetical protein
MGQTLFWKDRWLASKTIQELAPRLFSLVSRRRINKCTVGEALSNEAWLDDLQGNISVEALMEFLEIWDIASNMVLTPETPDKHIWRLSSSGQYTSKSAYDALFEGAILFEPYQRIWKSSAPLKCLFFFMWLVAHKRCWTTDRLSHRGLPHPALFPLCDQEKEDIQHLLVTYVFARQFWFWMLRLVGLVALTPQPHESSFIDWWGKVENWWAMLCDRG